MNPAPSAAPDQPPALEMVDVTVASMRDFERPTLEGVNWSVMPGDYWAIGGLQATGKSDLLATAAGLLPPLRGSYRVFGRELTPGYEHELLSVRLSVGLVFDSGRLLNNLTLAENVALPLRYHHNLSFAECADRVRQLLELVRLDTAAGHTPGALGRNVHRRVGLARALALKPKVLLVDNPLSGLDPREANWWLNLLDQLAAGHPLLDGVPLTLVVSGDQLRPWRDRARQFAALHERRFICLGSRDQLAAHTEPPVQELLNP